MIFFLLNIFFLVSLLKRLRNNINQGAMSNPSTQMMVYKFHVPLKGTKVLRTG